MWTCSSMRRQAEKPRRPRSQMSPELTVSYSKANGFASPSHDRSSGLPGIDEGMRLGAGLSSPAPNKALNRYFPGLGIGLCL